MVAVCTFRRNEPLGRLLAALARNDEVLGARARLGVVVVDDNPDGAAEAVVAGFDHEFPLGLRYRRSGEGNISLARNIGLETALTDADFVAMTDDDCEPVDDWIATYLADHARGGADILTGPCLLGGTDDAPSWLSDQPFLDDAQFRFEDGTAMDTAATNNSFLRADLLRGDHPLRFDPGLGVLGGEDMVFFRTAARDGARIRFCAQAAVRGHEPPERWTFRYQLRSRYWLGNTEFVTNRRLGAASRPRWFARGLLAIGRSAIRPVGRLATGRAPQLRYALAGAARGAGMAMGAIGVEVPHH